MRSRDHLSYGITVLPATRQRWFSRLCSQRMPAVWRNPIASTHLSTPEGWKAELT